MLDLHTHPLGAPALRRWAVFAMLGAAVGCGAPAPEQELFSREADWQRIGGAWVRGVPVARLGELTFERGGELRALVVSEDAEGLRVTVGGDLVESPTSAPPSSGGEGVAGLEDVVLLARGEGADSLVVAGLTLGTQPGLDAGGAWTAEEDAGRPAEERRGIEQTLVRLEALGYIER
jgi:hypothetical protein